MHSENIESNLVRVYKSYSIDNAVKEEIDQLNSTPQKSLIKLAKSLFTVAAKASSDSGISLIPVLIQTMINACQTIGGFSEFFRLKKFLLLLAQNDEISEKERSEFIREVETDYEFRERYCASLLSIVDRITELKKLQIIINIDIARKQKKIDNETFFRMMNLVDKLGWYELYAIYLLDCPYNKLEKSDFAQYRKLDKNYIESVCESSGILSIKTEIVESMTPQISSTVFEDESGKNQEIEKTPEYSLFGTMFIHFGFKKFKYQPHSTKTYAAHLSQRKFNIKLKK